MIMSADGDAPKASASLPQLRALVARLHRLLEQQKRTVARQIHDDLSQKLTVLAFELSSVQNRFEGSEAAALPPDFREKFNTLAELVDELIQAAQRITAELRPEVLDQFGLIAALECLSEQFQRRTGMRSEFSATAEDIALDPNRAIELFRLTQEILSNVARHSKASRVKIAIEEQRAGLTLQVWDNGRGITPKEISDDNSLGLLGIRERVRQLGGEITVVGTAGRGTTVTVCIPLKFGINPPKAPQ